MKMNPSRQVARRALYQGAFAQVSGHKPAVKRIARFDRGKRIADRVFHGLNVAEGIDRRRERRAQARFESRRAWRSNQRVDSIVAQGQEVCFA